MRKPFSRFTKNARIALKYSSAIADKSGSDSVELEHLFAGLLFVKDGVASKVLSQMGIDIKETITSLTNGSVVYGENLKDFSGEKKIGIRAREAISRSFGLASRLNHVYVGTEHLLLAILQDEKSSIVKDLKRAGVEISEIQKNVSSYATYPPGLLSKPTARLGRGKGKDDKPSALDIFGKDLTEMASNGELDPLVGRDEELEQVINIISRRRKNNPIVVGESGVGKTALVEGLAQKIVAGEVPETLRGTRIVSLDITSIIAGSKMRGDMEEKMMAIIDEVSSNPNIVIFIDEIHTILGSGLAAGGGLDLAGVLKPALVNGYFRCIGATTVADYVRYFDEDPALSRRFQRVQLEEATIEDSIKILTRLRPLLEAHHNVKISNDAVEQAVVLSDRYVSDRYLPDKAIDLMDEAAASRRIALELKFGAVGEAQLKYDELMESKEKALEGGFYDKASELRKKEEEIKVEIKKLVESREKFTNKKSNQVDSELIRQIVSKWTGIPVTTLGSSETSELLKLEDSIGDRVVGQSDAVKAVSDAIKRARTGITASDKPWASFLFLGPTGVGKTELAKVLTQSLFGNRDRLIQIDMSELMEMHSVSKLIGSPPGYIGYKEGGQLTEQVRKNPHSVILFDEIEKAHLDVLNLLLQILEYGHLTDSKGRKVDFKNTVIVLTSNIGAEDIRKDRVLGFEAKSREGNRSDKEIEQAYDGMREVLERELKDTLPPELINRLDDIIIFRSLLRRDVKKIVDILVNDLNSRLVDKKVSIKLDDGAREYIVDNGFSEEYGARPLRRIIQDQIETPVASYLLRYGGGLVAKGRSSKSKKVKNLIASYSKSLDKVVVKKA